MNFKTITHAGVTDTMDQALVQKIILSNVFSLLLSALVGIPFSVITFILARPLSFFPVIITVGVLASPFFNKLGLHMLARVLCSVLLICSVPLYHALLIPASSDPIVSVSVLSLSFCLVPFLLFNLKDWPVLVFIGLFSSFLLLYFDNINSWLELEVNDSFLQEGFFYHLVNFLGVVVGFAAIIGLVFMHQTESENNKALILAMEGKQNEIKESENELRNHLEDLKIAQKKEEIRQWQAEGLAHFSAILREEKDLKEMGDQLVSELCRYLKTNQGGLFVLDTEEKRLELVSCYAYGRKKYQQKYIEFGQGLLGQAYLEKDYIYMTDIPDKYTYITSGLGHATPDALLIMPMLYNNQVKGILEFASFNSFKEYEIELVQKLGEVIASTLHNVRANEKTRQLLREAQKNAEIVSAQEEELRQNMEELSAIHESMERKEKEYLKRIQELENQQV